jgi:hypothetical protein
MAKTTKSDDAAAGTAALAIAVMIPFALREKGILSNADIRKLVAGAAGFVDSDEFSASVPAAVRKRAGALLNDILERTPD